MYLGSDQAGDFVSVDGREVRVPFDRQPYDCIPQLSRDGRSAVGCSARSVLVATNFSSVEGSAELLTVKLPLPPGTNAALPLAINSDVLWDESAGLRGLSSVMEALSDDGRFLVGRGYCDSSYVAFRRPFED